MVLRPHITLFLSVCLSGVLLPISPLLALSPLCIWTAVMSFYLERRVIDRLLFPPFTAVTCWAALGTAIGIPIMNSQIQYSERMMGFGVQDWDLPMLTIQIVYLLSFPFAWIGYYYGGFRKVEHINYSSLFDGMTTLMTKKLLVIGWVFFLISVFTLVIRVRAGLENKDQGVVNIHAYGAFQMTLHLILSIAPKWSVLGFIFTPYLWDVKGVVGKLIILLLLGLYFIVALTTGSRGYILYPCCLMLTGYYFFRRRDFWKTEALIVILAILALFTVFVIYAYRNTNEYRSAKGSDIIKRYHAFNNIEKNYKKSKLRPEAAFDLGYSFYGFEDVKVFALSPEPVSHTGFSGFKAIPLTWIPTTIVKNKPKLLDAEFVVESYNKEPRNTNGLGISLTGDAYRRFGWIGIPVVVLIAFAIYGFIAHYILSWWRHGTLWGIILLCFSMTFFWCRPFGTVLGTWWAFFYDIPKQLLATGMLCFFVSKIVDWYSKAYSTVDKNGELQIK